MVLETQPIPYLTWLQAQLPFFFQVVLLASLGGLVVGYLIAAFRYGPMAGGDITFQVFKTAVSEVFQLSPRRIFALARLAVQESIRRRVMVAFGVFLLILLFAGWFLDAGTSSPAILYLSFVLTCTTYLVLLLALFLSAFSLPQDMKNKTIYTIVTKPVRPGEIVIGRILGFSFIGTVMLVVMGVFSYFFVIRLLNHTHEVEVASLQDVPEKSGFKSGRSSKEQDHLHTLTIDADGRGVTDFKRGHMHEIEPRTIDGKTVHEIGPALGMLSARVPVYGDLRFVDRTGQQKERGISVGHEWSYRSFVEGGTPAGAVWTFHDVAPDRFPHGLPLEMTIRVFRSYKGDINRGILGSLTVVNPKDRKKRSNIANFRAKDAEIDEHLVELELTDSKRKPVNLFKDLVDDEGNVEIELQCLDPAQYFGVARGDLYIRASDASFTINFIKGFCGIWAQMVLVTAFAVMFSTFVSGPVAMLGTLASIVLGFFSQFVVQVADGIIKGGGPLESLVRIFNQSNTVVEMEAGFTTDFVKFADGQLMTFMKGVAQVVPNFYDFSSVDYVAHGFDIPLDMILIQLTKLLAYLLVVFIVAYFFLKTREVAK